MSDVLMWHSFSEFTPGLGDPLVVKYNAERGVLNYSCTYIGVGHGTILLKSPYVGVFWLPKDKILWRHARESDAGKETRPENVQRMVGCHPDEERLNFLERAAKECGWDGWSCEEDGTLSPANQRVSIREAIDLMLLNQRK